MKLPKKGRKKADDKENIPVNVNQNYVMYNGVEWYQTQLDQLHALFSCINNSNKKYSPNNSFFQFLTRKNLFYLQGHKHRNQNAHQIDKRKIQVLCVHNFYVILFLIIFLHFIN